MVDFAGAIMAVVGMGLFFICGYAISLVFFKKNEADDIERLVYSLVFSLTIPPLAIFFLNFLFRIPINTIFVYLIYIIIAGASYFYHITYGEGKKKV